MDKQTVVIHTIEYCSKLMNELLVFAFPLRTHAQGR